MNKEVSQLFTDYKRGRTSRRDFLRKLALYAGSTAAAMAMIPMLEDNFATAAVPSENDEGLITDYITYPGQNTEMKAFMARPDKEGKFPAVIVIHEIFGLNTHIEDVTKRMAKEGFLTIAPDALSPKGGTPQDDQSSATTLIRELDADENIQNFVAAVSYLKTNPLCTGKVGCTGFCWGGGMTNQVAVHAPELDAAVPYYGTQPALEDVEKIQAPIMAHYGENDERINAGIEAFEDALKLTGKDYQIFIYEGAGHAFNNDSNPDRYNEAAAKLAWERTVKFFKEKLT